jgi:hypothetical protein
MKELRTLPSKYEAKFKIDGVEITLKTNSGNEIGMMVKGENAAKICTSLFYMIGNTFAENDVEKVRASNHGSGNDASATFEIKPKDHNQPNSRAFHLITRLLEDVRGNVIDGVDIENSLLLVGGADLGRRYFADSLDRVAGLPSKKPSTAQIQRESEVRRIIGEELVAAGVAPSSIQNTIDVIVSRTRPFLGASEPGSPRRE